MRRIVCLLSVILIVCSNGVEGQDVEPTPTPDNIFFPQRGGADAKIGGHVADDGKQQPGSPNTRKRPTDKKPESPKPPIKKASGGLVKNFKNTFVTGIPDLSIIVDGSITGKTDAAGRYSVSLAEGKKSVSINKNGKLLISTEVTVSRNKNVFDFRSNLLMEFNKLLVAQEKVSPPPPPQPEPVDGEKILSKEEEYSEGRNSAPPSREEWDALYTSELNKLQRQGNILSSAESLFYAAKGYKDQHNGNLNLAVNSYKTAVEGRPNSAILHLLLAKAQFLNADYEGALPNFIKVFELNPKITTALEFAAEIQIRTNRTDSAIKSLNALKNIGKTSESLNARLLVLILSKDGCYMAIEAFLTLEKIRGINEDTANKLSDCLINQQKFSRVAPLIAQVPSENSPILNYKLGIGYFGVNEFEKAIESFERALMLDSAKKSLPEKTVRDFIAKSKKRFNKSRQTNKQIGN
jgi:tetratricopeptide (TPR) repeat protein